MKSKMLEIRDRGTQIPVLAIKTEPETREESKFFHVGGYGEETVILLKVDPELDANYDAYKWRNSRTMRTAHNYIQSNYDKLDNYSVVDVEYILGETDVSKASEVWA